MLVFIKKEAENSASFYIFFSNAIRGVKSRTR